MLRARTSANAREKLTQSDMAETGGGMPTTIQTHHETLEKQVA